MFDFISAAVACSAACTALVWFRWNNLPVGVPVIASLLTRKAVAK